MASSEFKGNKFAEYIAQVAKEGHKNPDKINSMNAPFELKNNEDREIGRRHFFKKTFENLNPYFKEIAEKFLKNNFPINSDDCRQLYQELDNHLINLPDWRAYWKKIEDNNTNDIAQIQMIKDDIIRGFRFRVISALFTNMTAEDIRRNAKLHIELNALAFSFEINTAGEVKKESKQSTTTSVQTILTEQESDRELNKLMAELLSKYKEAKPKEEKNNDIAELAFIFRVKNVKQMAYFQAKQDDVKMQSNLAEKIQKIEKLVLKYFDTTFNNVLKKNQEAAVKYFDSNYKKNHELQIMVITMLGAIYTDTNLAKMTKHRDKLQQHVAWAVERPCFGKFSLPKYTEVEVNVDTTEAKVTTRTHSTIIENYRKQLKSFTDRMNDLEEKEYPFVEHLLELKSNDEQKIIDAEQKYHDFNQKMILLKREINKLKFPNGEEKAEKKLKEKTEKIFSTSQKFNQWLNFEKLEIILKSIQDDFKKVKAIFNDKNAPEDPETIIKKQLNPQLEKLNNKIARFNVYLLNVKDEKAKQLMEQANNLSSEIASFTRKVNQGIDSVYKQHQAKRPVRKM